MLYCMELLNANLNKLQLAQNSAACMLTQTRKFDHISPVQRFHWLLVWYRIQFKLPLLTWKALHDTAPSYISELINICVPSRQLRSSNNRFLNVPWTFSSHGNRAFCSSASRLWNYTSYRSVTLWFTGHFQKDFKDSFCLICLWSLILLFVCNCLSYLFFLCSVPRKCLGIGFLDIWRFIASF